MKTALLLALLVSCTSDSQPDPATATEKSSMLWTCYTHASCDGNVVNQEHRLCASASAQDYTIVGDAAARDWVTLWSGACRADEGIVTPTAERAPGQVCVNLTDGTPEPWGCDADCIPQFEGC